MFNIIYWRRNLKKHPMVSLRILKGKGNYLVFSLEYRCNAAGVIHYFYFYIYGSIFRLYLYILIKLTAQKRLHMWLNAIVNHMKTIPTAKIKNKSFGMVCMYVYFKAFKALKALKSQNQTCKGIEFLSQPEIF